MTVMTAIPFDRLRYTDMLRNAGIDEKSARAHADALDDAMRQGVATKSDISDVRSDMQGVRQELKTDIAELRQELKTDIAELRHELKTDIAELRHELKTEISELRQEVKTEISELRQEVKTEISGLRQEVKTDIAGLEIAFTRIIVEKHVATLQWLAGGLTGLFVGTIAVIKLFK